MVDVMNFSAVYSQVVFHNHHEHAPARSVAIFANCLHVQWSWARRHSVNRQIFAGWKPDSTVCSHVVLGLPAGCFQSFGGRYVSECSTHVLYARWQRDGSMSCNVFRWREVFTACYKYVSAWFLLYQFNMNISVSFPFQTVQSENFTLCDVTVLGVFAKCKVYWEFLKSNTETYEKHNLCKAADCQRITLADTRVSIRESIHQHSKQFAWQHNIH